MSRDRQRLILTRHRPATLHPTRSLEGSRRRAREVRQFADAQVRALAEPSPVAAACPSSRQSHHPTGISARFAPPACCRCPSPRSPAGSRTASRARVSSSLSRTRRWNSSTTRATATSPAEMKPGSSSARVRSRPTRPHHRATQHRRPRGEEVWRRPRAAMRRPVRRRWSNLPVRPVRAAHAAARDLPRRSAAAAQRRGRQALAAHVSRARGRANAVHRPDAECRVDITGAARSATSSSRTSRPGTSAHRARRRRRSWWHHRAHPTPPAHRAERKALVNRSKPRCSAPSPTTSRWTDRRFGRSLEAAALPCWRCASVSCFWCSVTRQRRKAMTSTKRQRGAKQGEHPVATPLQRGDGNSTSHLGDAREAASARPDGAVSPSPFASFT